MKNIRALPAIASTLMTLVTGFFGASGSLTVIITLILPDEGEPGLTMGDIFLFFAVLGRILNKSHFYKFQPY